jgi:PAS domain S-box-containing protein
VSKASILIVEDEAIVAEDVGNKLKRLGYEICGTTGSGEEAVALAREKHPSLVLMDIRLRGRMDGVEAAQSLRKENDIPVIYLTAHSDAATLERAKQSEPFGYILKPFEEPDLETHIQMALYKHRADQEVRRQREWFEVTLRSIGDAVITTDAQGRVTLLNGVAEEMTGWKLAEAQGRPIGEIFNIINEESRAAAQNPVERVMREGKVVGLANHTVLISKAGRERAIDDSAAPIQDGRGRILGVVMVFHDVTEKRQAEAVLARSNAELEKAVAERTAALQEMVEELEHFSHTITHDMRAPLRAIQGFASLMSEACGDCTKTESKEHLGLIRDAAARMDRLITDALQYSKAGKQAMALGPVDVASLLRGIVASYPTMQGPGAEVKIEGTFPKVMANEAGLTQCFANLLSNAVKFVAPGIRPRVRVTSEARDGMVRVWFEDNGIGISREAQNKIFQLFQRATRDYEGTGVGLALAKKVTERMEGRIGVESVLGQGSRFWVELAPAR